LVAQDRKGVLIVDAGGGTIDVSAYKKASDHYYEEISIPQCKHVSLIPYILELTKDIGALKGSIFVTRNFRDFLESATNEPTLSSP